MSMKRGYMLPRLNATKVPTEAEIGWAAGIYEGEGTCCSKATVRRIKGRVYHGAADYLSVTQKDCEILNRLRDLFGGSVYEYSLTENHKYKGRTFYRWTLHGQRARNFALAIYPWLSARRKEQIDKVHASLQYPVETVRSGSARE